HDAPAWEGDLALPGEHNRQNAGTALAALALAGVPRDEAAPVLARFTGTGRRFEVSEAGGVTIVDDYGHHPREVAMPIAAVRGAGPGARGRRGDGAPRAKAERGPAAPTPRTTSPARRESVRQAAPPPRYGRGGGGGGLPPPGGGGGGGQSGPPFRGRRPGG